MKSLSQFPQPDQLTLWSVLGLSGRGTEQWVRLRGFQYAQLALVARTRLLAQALAAVVTVLLFTPIVGHGAMAGWLGALCGSLTYSVRSDAQLGDAERRRMSADEFRRQALGTIINIH